MLAWDVSVWSVVTTAASIYFSLLCLSQFFGAVSIGSCPGPVLSP